MKKSYEIRQDFLDFFKSKQHTIVPSASVIPFEDPTLLFTNAGMNQFKDVFLGNGKRDYVRCADTQKCIRVSGKHNDLEEVGHDGYHHTFFEMLGNWSFGDYYKPEAIRWAWELLTGLWGLEKSRLWATVYEEDEEALKLWKSETDIDHSHILKFGAKDNFWEMGDTGPCGPCSEIHYDFTSEGCKGSDVNADNPDVMEIWNLVFIQYNRDTEGKLHDLPAKHVDTGMGFERMVRVLQNKKSNYETDVFLPLINELIALTRKEYSTQYEASMNVIADHIRTLTFAIADGAIPSNEGRGYVLRRILRRAARYGRNLDMRKPFIYNLVDVLVNTMGSVFPEIVEKKKFIKEIVQGEEESFNETLDRGLVFFNEEIDNMNRSVGTFERTSANAPKFSGDVAFKLHDTYGFPVDLTQLMAREKGFEVDVVRFDELMKEQKDRARGEREKKNKSDDLLVKFKFPDGAEVVTKMDYEYDPYNIDENGVKTSLIGVGTTNSDKNFLLMLWDNPFYSESGGQVSDTGVLIAKDNKNNDIQINIIDSIKSGVITDKVYTDIMEESPVIAKVDLTRRRSIQRNHSATHIMHEALKRVLGPHVKQMGSYLDDKVLRFDFPHFHKLKPEEIDSIEEIVNGKIAEKINVYAEEMPIDKANKIPHVKKFFGEKYGNDVRVVFIDESFSIEFCGGTHVRDTTDIGLFKIIKEESISSGTRRIFARTGQGILDYINERIAEIDKIASELPEKYYTNFKSGIESFRSDFKSADYRDSELLKKLLKHQDSTLTGLAETKERYLEEKKHLEKQLAKDKVKNATESLDSLIASPESVNNVKYVKAAFDDLDMDELKDAADALRVKLKSAVGLLYSVSDGKVNIVAVVTDDLIKSNGLNAGKIAGDFAKMLGGGGGGRPQLATAGGKDASKIDEALTALPNIIKKYL